MVKWFTADPHFGHHMDFRLFDTVEDQDAYILDEINRRVGRKDHLYILGDFSLKYPEIRHKIKCKNVHLIWGNHDPRNKIVGKGFFSTVREVHEVRLLRVDGEVQEKHKCWLSHYPHCYWPSSHYGSLHLYGHVHSAREETLDAAFPGRRSMDVGVDNAKLILGSFRPFREDEVLDLLLAKPGHDFVDFYREKQGRIKRASS